MNLLKETKEELKNHNKDFYDILWIGCNKFYVDIEKFKEIADTDYDSGYGAPNVAEDLLVVGDNWWLERHEYDGSEWWEYKECPTKPKEKIVLKALTIDQAKKLYFEVSCGWENLKAINGIEDYEGNSLK